MNENRVLVVGTWRMHCPIDGKACLGDVARDHDVPTCAWWIPGAECCALVQIARKLNDLACLKEMEAGMTRVG